MHHDALPSSVIAPSMVGRDAQLAACERLLGAVAAGQPGPNVLAIRGEAGIGKSRLLAALQARAGAAAWRVVASTCFEYSQSVPYAPVIDLLRGGETPPPPVLLSELAGGAERQGAAPFGGPQDSAQEQHRLFGALAAWFAGLADTGPLLLCVEDLQWADTATMALLPVLARALAGRPALIAVTARAEESPAALRSALAELNRRRLLAEVTLVGLGRDEVAAIVAACLQLERPVNAELLDALCALTDGNPFFVEEVITALVSTGAIFYADGAWNRKPVDELRIPQSIHEAVAQRAATLSAGAREVLTLAAALGRRFDFAVLQQVTGHDEATLLALVKELIGVQLVVEESADQLAFRHALGRAAIYGGLLSRERRVLHRRLAEALEHAGGAVYQADLARHFAEAQVWDKALHYASAAAEAALRAAAPREAVTHLTGALAAARRVPGATLAPLLLRRGQAQAMLDSFVAALADYEEALAEARARGDRLDEWQALLDLGFLWSSRDLARAGEYFERMLDCARAIGDPARLAHSLNRLGNWQLNLDRPHAAREAHREAYAIFSELGDEHGLAATLDLLGISGYLCGDLAAGTASFERAIALFEAQQSRHALLNSLAQLSLRYEFDTEALDCASLRDRAAPPARAVALAREVGWRGGETFARIMHGSFLIGLGEYGAALETLETSLAMAREIEHQMWAAQALGAIGVLYLDLLQLPLAVERLREALTLARGMDLVLMMRDIARYLAAAYARQRRLDQAEDVLRQAVAFARGHHEPSLITRQVELAHAELALARDEPQRALVIVDALINTTANRGEQVVPRLWLARGEALAGLRRYAEAEAALAGALAAAEAQGRRPLVWRAQAALARCADGLRRREAAQALAVAAREQIDALARALPPGELRDSFRASAHAAVPDPGALTPRQALKQAFDGLTDRELEVVRMIARGYTNRQIAAALVLSERTVGTHIGNIYGKLGLTARAQVIRWAVEKGISPAE